MYDPCCLVVSTMVALNLCSLIIDTLGLSTCLLWRYSRTIRFSLFVVFLVDPQLCQLFMYGAVILPAI